MVRGQIVDKEEATKFTMAWLRATNDPLVGTDQDSETFQIKVKEELERLEMDVVPPGKYHMRGHLPIYKYIRDLFF